MVADFHDVTENFICERVKYLIVANSYGCGLARFVNSWRLVASTIYYGHPPDRRV